jgi:putative transposase
MARIARVVAPRLPHHVAQRGNRREPVFFGAEDHQLYRRLIAAAARRAGAEIWAYCLIPDHVHSDRDAGGQEWAADDLWRSAPPLHPSTQGFGWTGHLFQGRFAAVVMDGPRLLAAAGYIALNPVVAGGW